MAKAGVETALWDLEAKLLQHSFVEDAWRRPASASIAASLSEFSRPSISCSKRSRSSCKAGYQRIKIKIKPGWDVEVVRQVRGSFPTILLMADANSAYTLADVHLFKKMDKYNIMMFEQPLDYEDIIDHAELQRQVETPICLDESIHSADDARKAIQIGACRIINVKLGRLGGHREVRAVHDVCRDNGIAVWCGGMLESGIGRAHNVALSSLENFTLPGDVTASKRYWSEDIIKPAVEVSQTARSHNWMRPVSDTGSSRIWSIVLRSLSGVFRMTIYEADWICPVSSAPIRQWQSRCGKRQDCKRRDR